MTVTTAEQVFTTPTRVLYVDPDRETLHAVQSVLETEYGMEVSASTNAEDALESLDERSVDCIVSELTLPGMNGIDFLRTVRSRNPELPFIFFTEVPYEEYLEVSPIEGITDYLRKDSFENYDRWLGMRIATAKHTQDSPHAEGLRIGGSCYLDEELRIVRASESVGDVYGVDADELRGTSWPELHDDHGVNLATILSEADVTGYWEGETTGIRSDGSTFPRTLSVVKVESNRYFATVVEYSGRPCRDDVSDSIQTAARKLCRGRRFPRDVDVILETCAEKIRSTLEADHVGIFEYRSDENAYVYRTGAGWNGIDGSSIQLGMVFDPDRPSAAEMAVERWDGEHSSETDALRQLADRGIVSGIGVPILESNGVWGLIGTFSTERRTFSSNDVAFVRTICALLTFAIERDRRVIELEALSDLVTQLFETETRRELCDLVAEIGDGIPQFASLGIYLFDEPNDVLRLTSRSHDSDRRFSPKQIVGAGDGPVWNAFIENQPTFVADVFPRPTTTVPDPSNAYGVIVPLDRHGVLLVGTADPILAIGSEFKITVPIATLLRTAFERIELERELDSRRERINEQATRIERLSEMSELVQNVDRELVETSSRGSLETAVCTHLVEYEPVVFAWIGEYDDVTETITPAAWAGEEKSYLSGVSINLNESVDEQDPMGTAVKRRETYQSLRLMDDVPPNPWQRDALKRGYRSVLSVPIVYQKCRYGGITIYSDRPTVFDEEQRQLFEDIGSRLGFAFNAFDRKHALVESGSVIELEFRVRDERIPFVQWSAETGCRFECETIISRPDGSLRGFFTVEGAKPEQILSLAERSSAVRETKLVTERNEKALFQCILTEDSVGTRVLEYGAVPTLMSASDDEGRIVVELSEDAKVREFVTVFESSFPDSELVRRRHRERRPLTHYEFTAKVEDELTDRQLEALRTAYFSGYFETPRENSGKDIASLLGIAQPTLNHHLRTAQRKLFAMLFTDDETDHCQSMDSE